MRSVTFIGGQALLDHQAKLELLHFVTKRYNLAIYKMVCFMNWQDFLSTQTLTEQLNTTAGLYPVTALAVLQISGTDAATFLQGQITGNVHDVTEQQAKFAAMCNPKGRVISTFILKKHTDGFLLILPTALITTVKERLQRYVLRAKVSLTLTDLSVLGVSSSNTDFLSTEQHCIHLGQRDLLLTNDVAAVWQDFLARGYQATTEQCWQYLDIVAGLPWLTLDTSEQFIPQMLNLDALGGISYSKGCYTGQEIVARTHYLGKAKRALFVAESSITAQPNTDIINAAGQGVGLVLASAFNTLLIVLQDGATSELTLKGYNAAITL